MCCKPTGASRSRSCAARASACSTPRAASTSICSRASAWRRSATLIAASRRAIAEQAETLIHTSNLFYHPLQGQLAERLANLSGLPRAFFCNSGTEAVEACLKFARRYWYTQGEPRPEFIALDESFHGRTIGSLSVTSDEHYRTPFEPLLPSVHVHAAPTIRRARSAAVSSKTAAIIVEPIQGEGGIRPLTPAFAAAINEACRRRPARCSSPTKCRAASAAPAIRSTSRRSA